MGYIIRSINVGLDWEGRAKVYCLDVSLAIPVGTQAPPYGESRSFRLELTIIRMN